MTLVAGPNGEVGAAKLTGEVLEIVRRLPKVIEEITGVDMGKVCLGVYSFKSEDLGREILYCAEIHFQVF